MYASSSTRISQLPHTYVNELGSIGSINGLPVRRQAIAWTNVD